LNIELILSKVLKCPRIQLYLDFDKPLTPTEISDFKELLKRRLKYEPLQYILGTTNFFGYDIIVNRNVMIPRPDTEILVETFLIYIDNTRKNNFKILEIGSGSGCISISIAKELMKRGLDFRIKSIDNSEEALNISRLNQQKLEIPDDYLTFVFEDIFEIDNFNGFEFIISNPPYISLNDYLNLDEEVRNFEPRTALTDEDKGYKFYERIFELLKISEHNHKLFCEIGYNQKNNIELILNQMNFNKIEFYKDLNDIYRVLTIDK
jgi:release factor glutamine methyltransferase